MTIPIPLASTAQNEAPPVLLPYQTEWIADTSQLKVEEKSRRTGLTWAEAADDVLIAAAEKSAGGMNVYYIGYNQDMAIEFVEACAMWARAFNYVAGEIEEGLWEEDKDDRHIKTYTIRFPGSGHRIVALSSRPANLRGKQGVVVLDEAAFHDKLDELLKAALALLIWGGKVRVISTHDGEENPFNELVKEIRSGKRKGTVHRIDFKDAIDQGLYRRVCLRLGREWSAEEEKAWMEDVYAFYGDAAEEELDVVPSQGSGTFLSRAIIERCMKRELPVVRWRCDNAFVMLPDHIRQAEAKDFCEEYLQPLLIELDPRLLSFFGMDFGRSGDLSVFWPLQQLQNLRYRTPFVLEMSNVPFEEQRFILFYILDRLPRLSGGRMDARGNGQYLAERTMQKYGTRIEPVMLTEPWYREEMPRLKAFFEDDTWEIPADADHVTDFRAFKMIRGVARLPELRTKGANGMQRHGDAGIAGVLAVSATRIDIQEYAYDPIRKSDLAELPRDIRTTAGFGRQKGIW
jgi:phage FluMu gp28-like protein